MKAFFLVILLSITNITLSDCNFRHADYINELRSPSSIESIEIIVPKSANFAKNFLKIISSHTINIPPSLKKNFSAKISVHYPFGKCEFLASVKQSGDWKDHVDLINGNSIRSLSIKLKNGNIQNAVKFKLLIPKTRNDLNEVLGALIFRQLGFIAPETFQVLAKVNGVQHMMLFQEDAEKELLERNQRREGPLFEGDESILFTDNGVFSERNRMSLARLTNKNWMSRGRSSLVMSARSFYRLQSGFLAQSNKLHPIPLDGLKSKNEYDFYFLNITLNGKHALIHNNRRWYFNAFNDQIEPIYYDGDLDLKKALDSSSINPEFFYKNFKFSYMDEIFNPKFSSDLKGSFLQRTKINQNLIDSFFEQSMSTFKKNVIFLQNQIHSQTNFVKKNSKGAKNVTDYLGYVKKLNIDQRSFFSSENIESSEFTELNGNKIIVTSEDFKDLISNNQFRGNRAVILPSTNYNYNNWESLVIKKDIFGISGPDLVHTSSLKYSIDSTKKQLILKQQLPSDWALLRGGEIQGWNISFIGERNVNINPLDNKERFNSFGMTGCLNLYDIFFKSSSIKSIGGTCEDSINIVSSFGNLDNLKATYSLADAIDIDFSDIDIDKVTVSQAGNDCLDVSSGKYSIKKLSASNCGDKAISVGEVSDFILDKVNINSAATGVSSKDLSKVSINYFVAGQVQKCAEATQKKQEFGGANMEISNMICNGTFSVDRMSNISYPAIEK